MVTICAGTLALVGLRQRSVGGALLAGVATTAAIRALLGYRDLDALRRLAETQFGDAAVLRDEVEYASTDSFPASDAPGWTPTAGAGVRLP